MGAGVSAWGKSWGKSWGNSWGSADNPQDASGGGFITAARANRERHRSDDDEVMLLITAFVSVVGQNEYRIRK